MQWSLLEALTWSLEILNTRHQTGSHDFNVCNKTIAQLPENPVFHSEWLLLLREVVFYIFSIIIKSSWVLLLTETKALKSALLPWWSIFCSFLSLNEMGSGTVGFSESSSMLTATTVKCFDIFLMRSQALKKHIWKGIVDLRNSVQLLTQRKLVRSQDPDNTACVPVLLAIIHSDNWATCNEQLGPCVGAEAGPVLIWDKDRLLINGP